MRERGIKATESHLGNGGAAQEVRVCRRSFESDPVCFERAEEIVPHLHLVDAQRELHVRAPRGERFRTLRRDTVRPGIGGENNPPPSHPSAPHAPECSTPWARALVLDGAFS